MIREVDLQIGALEIDKDCLKFDGHVRYDASHKFIVEARENVALLFMCPANSHPNVARHFRKSDAQLVGGGSVFLTRDDILYICDYSGKCGGPLPQVVAQKFAEMVAEALRTTHGLEIKGAVGDPNFTYYDVLPYWTEGQ